MITIFDEYNDIINEVKTKLGQNQSKVAELTKMSYGSVNRVLNKRNTASRRTINTILSVAIQIIQEEGGQISTPFLPSSKIEPNHITAVQSVQVTPEIISIIESTAKKTSMETAEALGYASEIITRQEAIMQYFKGKASRYERHMERHKDEISISKGEGKNSLITMSRRDLVNSLRKHKIAS